jgi:hypothetical protein
MGGVIGSEERVSRGGGEKEDDVETPAEMAWGGTVHVASLLLSLSPRRQLERRL